MTISLRTYAGFLVLVALLVVASVLGGRGGLASSEASLPPDLGVDRIAYVGPDGHVRSVDPDGSDVRQISSGDGFFTWPTWSPDAIRLVYSGVTGDRSADPRISLFYFNTRSGRTRELYVSEPGVTGLLADGVVHYPLWSPDSSRLAFIAVTSAGLSLLLGDLSGDVTSDPLLDDGPLWMSWASDSDHLLVHRGADHFLVHAGDGNRVSRLDVRAAEYRVPAWRPGERTVTLVSSDEVRRLSLVNARVAGERLGETKSLTRVSPEPAFLWSPDGAYLAVGQAGGVLSYLGRRLFLYRGLRLYPSLEEVAPIDIPESVLAFFWSPDGSRLAYVTAGERRTALRWSVFDVKEGTSRPLVDFVPSADQMTMFQFFDQYAYSHAVWSPDSSRLVFSGLLDSTAVTASTRGHPGHQGPHVIVVGVEGASTAEYVVEGSLGVWSPR